MRFISRGLITLIGLIAATGGAALLAQRPPALQALRVSDNKRFLVTADGRPFFWLGDTAWELFHRLTREDAVRYLDNRAALRFTVIQAVALAEFDGLDTPNAYGHRPLINNDPATPDVKDGADNDYWDHVDFVVAEARARGLVRRPAADVGRQMEPAEGRRPGDLHPGERRSLRRLARPPVPRRRQHHLDRRRRSGGRQRHAPRDRQRHGPRPPRGRRAAAISSRFIRAATTAPRRTFTTRRGSTSTCARTATASSTPAATSERRPTTIACRSSRCSMANRSTRTIPISFAAPTQGHSIAADVRRADVLGSVQRRVRPHLRPSLGLAVPGARSHAGEQPADAVDRGDQPAGGRPDAAWPRAARVAAVSDAHSRRRRDCPGGVATSVPGAGRYRFVATRDEAGTYAMVYVPAGRPFTVRLSKIAGAKVVAWWFNPRTGQATADSRVRQDRHTHLHSTRSGRSARLGAGPRRRRRKTTDHQAASSGLCPPFNPSSSNPAGRALRRSKSKSRRVSGTSRR